MLREVVSRETFEVLVLYQRPIWINNTETSLGDTPLIRDACEIVIGRILLNFCFASIDIDLILL